MTERLRLPEDWKELSGGYNKVVYGDILSEAIGLERIREKSPRFHQWITCLENI